MQLSLVDDNVPTPDDSEAVASFKSVSVVVVFVAAVLVADDVIEFVSLSFFEKIKLFKI